MSLSSSTRTGRLIPEPTLSLSKRLLPWLVAVAFFMEALDTTILNTAVPTIAAALKATPLSLKSVLASYTLSLAVFIPVSGWMADRFGTRRVFAAAIAVFTLGSFLCGISSNTDVLVACRILQGAGGAMMVPVGRLTLVRTFPKNELIQTMSFVAIPALVGPLLGPITGGLIVHYLSWRVIFFVNVPIGIIGLIFVYLYLPDHRNPQPRPLDFVGFILFGSGVGLLSYVLEVFGEHRLSTIETLSLLALSVVLIGGYVAYARRTAFPLLNLHLAKVRTFRVAVLGSFITRLGIGGVPFLLPLLYQVGLGMTAVQSGLLIVPQAIAAMSTKFWAPRVLERLGYRIILVSNTLLIGVLILLFATIGTATPIWVIVVQAFCYGAFMSLQFTSMNTLVYADVVEADTSAASTIASTLQQMSISFGVAVAGLATVFFLPDPSRQTPASMIDGIHEAFLVLGGFTILSTVVFRELKADDGQSVSKQKALEIG